MRRTHLETFFANIPEGELFLEGFRRCAEQDVCPNQIVPEITAFESFSPNLLKRTGYENSPRDLVLIQHMYHAWKDRNYFDITPELFQRLRETDLQDVDSFFLNTPFRSMYLSVPKGNGIFVPERGETKYELSGIYILSHVFETPSSIALEKIQKTVENVSKYLSIATIGEGIDPLDDAVVYYYVLFWDGKISDSIERNKSELGLATELWPTVKETFEFIAKTLLYIGCSNANVRQEVGVNLEAMYDRLKNPSKKRKLLQRYSKVSLEPHKVLDTIIRDHDSEKYDSETREGRKKGLEKVRRHIKTQRFGTNLSKTKLIWVESYSRGSFELDSSRKSYRVV